MSDERMDCGCRMVRCKNPDCREPIYATDGVCRACAPDSYDRLTAAAQRLVLAPERTTDERKVLKDG